MKNKRDILLIILCLFMMVGCSNIVPDSRLMTPTVEPIVEKAAREVMTKIETAHYLCFQETEEEIEEEIEEAPAEEVIVESYDDEPLYTEENEESYEEEIAYEPGLIYMGEYEITAYEYTGSTCANGNYPTPWYTVASNYFDFGTTLYIDGVGYVVVEDRGANWHSDNWLDLYIGDEAACYEWGIQYRDVYLVE